MRLRAFAGPYILVTSVSPVICRCAATIIAVLLCLTSASRTFGTLANAWHIPDNSGDLGFSMRNPEFEIGTNTTMTIYSGLQKFNNSFGTANQTGGTLYYKGLTQGVWNSTNLQF